MGQEKFSQGLGDLDINLDKADDIAGGEADNTDTELKDIPVDEENAENKADDTDGTDQTTGTKDSSPELDLNLGQEESTQELPHSEQQEEIDNVIDDIDRAKIETEIATLKTMVTELRNENDILYDRLKNLKTDFDEHVLYRIPKYQEMELPGSKYDPQFIVPHIGNALDKVFMKVFRDVPRYEFKAFEIIDKDEDENIENALVTVHIEFSEHSMYRFLKFDMELWIIGGYLQVPQWFVFDRKLYTLTEAGVRKLDLVANRMDRENEKNLNPYYQESWYNMNRDNKKNPIPHQVEIPQTTQNQSENVWYPRKQF